jgi:hypothetical protein
MGSGRAVTGVNRANNRQDLAGVITEIRDARTVRSYWGWLTS